MQKSVLLELVRSLNKKEIREIQKWLLSPAHNQRQDVIRLFEFLYRNIQEPDEHLTKEKVWPFVFPEEPYDDARMRQVMYFLMKNMEEYLSFTEMNKDTVHVQSVLLKVYRNRQLDKPFRLNIETTRKRQGSSVFRNSAFLWEQHALEQEQYLYLVGKKWSMELNLQETADALDMAYIADKFRTSCRMLAHQNVYKKVSYDMGTMEMLMKYVEERNLLDEPAIAVYYHSFRALTQPDGEENFQKLENLIFEKGSLFPDNELREMYLLAINYCVNRLNAGQLPYVRKGFDFYKKGFDKNILLENGTVSRFAFGNAVTLALRVGEYNWAETFITSFQEKLEDKYRESTVNFNLARLYFEKGDYGKAQQVLARFEYDDMVLNLSAKTILLKIYYEEMEHSAFESLLESMRTYLQRKEAITQNYRIVFKNMLSVMRKLLHLNPYSKTQKEKFRELVQQTNPLIEKEWLLKQLDPR